MNQAACYDMFESVLGGFGSLEDSRGGAAEATPGPQLGRRYGRRPNGIRLSTSTDTDLTVVALPEASSTAAIWRELREEKELMSRIDQLAAVTAVSNWDGERGEPVSARQWDDARRLLAGCLVELRGIPAPFISACGDGSAHLQWTTPAGDRGVLEIGAGAYWWSFLPMGDDLEDEVVELQALRDGLERVRALFRRA
ncbi:MAG: hypothetical protein JW751_19535 [Polyangiaceae bacterium]|nr:hypothetical protein [Polyangiaceae bacterium]